jgi:uncharacterized SAM-binding protein YcdF (DUF218 family)
MSRLIAYVVSAGGFACLAVPGVIWLNLRPHARGPRRWLTAVVLCYCAAGIRVVPWILSRPLVYGFHDFTAADAPRDATAIVVLGAGSYTVAGADQRMGLLDLAGAARVLEAAHVYRLMGSPWIISSGGAAEGLHIEPSAVTMRNGLVQLGVPENRILLDTESSDTHDEAVGIAPMLRALQVNRIVLVTSDIHMRRAIATFRAAGMTAVPAIAEDPLNSQSRIRTLIPTSEGLRFTSFVVHEYAGLVYYAARGWLRF